MTPEILRLFERLKAYSIARLSRRFFARLSNLAVGSRADHRLLEEIEEHLAQQTTENVRASMPAAEARRRAVLKFGAAGAVRESYHAESNLPIIETLSQDVRYAVRQLAASPGFASVAILTIALGIGATTAICSVVDATVLHPLPYPHPGQLVRIENDFPGIGATDVSLSVPEWKDFERSGILQYISPERAGSVNLTGSSQPARIDFKSVAPNYFALLGVKPELVSQGLSDRECMERPAASIRRNGSWQCATATTFDHGRGGIGFAHRVRQRRQSSARARHHALTRNGDSAGAWSGKSRLICQLFTESLLLSLLGGIAGLTVLFLSKKLLLQMIPASLPRLNDISIHWTVLLFALNVSVLAGVFFGVDPALHAAKADPNHVLRQEGRGSRGSSGQTWTLGALVVTEFALSLVLLIAAGLLLRSFWDLFDARLGFDPENVMAARVWLPVPNDPTTDIYGTPDQEARLIREILRRGQSLPGVNEVAVGSRESIPLNHDRDHLFTLVVEEENTRSNLPHQVQGASVTPNYFHLLGIPILRGRAITETDIDSAPKVALVNEAFARAWWPGEDSLGKRIKLGRASTFWSAALWTTVVGVVADARTESIEEESVPKVYLSSWQTTEKDLAIFLRGRLDPARVPDQARDMVQSIDPELPVFGAQRLPDIVSGSLAQRRFSLEIVLLFALTALLLAGIGVYGTISYIVSERTRDIGIRIALGAQKKSILHMILSQGLALVLAGAAVGLVGALIVAHLMAGLLYGVSPGDPLTFISLTAVMVIVAIAACYIPARRAMAVNPIVALREA